MSYRLRRIWWAGWFAGITVLSAGVVVYLVTSESGVGESAGRSASRLPLRPHPARPLRPRGKCDLVVGRRHDPTRQYVCNGHGWLLQDGKWQDLGAMPPAPMVPLG